MPRCWFAFVLLWMVSSVGIAEMPAGILAGGITSLPLRAVVEWSGGGIAAGQTPGSLTVSRREMTLCLRMNSAQATLNGAAVTLPTAIFLRDGVTYAPARTLAQALGATLTIDDDTQQLCLTLAERSYQCSLLCVNPLDGGEMVWVPAGEFVMGTSGVHAAVPDAAGPLSSTVREVGQCAEYPAHTVQLTGYWINQYEVTVAQYRRFCRATGRKMPTALATQSHDTAPMRLVTWADATAYAKWAGGRLPTEAEWERAARGTDGRAYPWGNRADARDTTGCPADVSPTGACDMSGNVKEWCADWFDVSYYRYSPWANPTGPSTGATRVVRGSSWKENAVANPWRVRCAFREGVAPTVAADDLGFRLVVPGKSAGTYPVRPALPIMQIGGADAVYTRAFPEGYRCLGAWHADLDGDGSEDVVAVAVDTTGDRPLLLRIFQSVARGVALRPVDDFTADEQQDGHLRWVTLRTEHPTDAPLPTKSFGISDVNGDGRLEISLILQSSGVRSHDEALYLFRWDGPGKLVSLGQIIAPDATKGEWIIDDLSREHPGLEIATVLRQVDTEYPAAYLPQWFVFTYYEWSGDQYQAYDTITTERKYPDALRAIAAGHR